MLVSGRWEEVKGTHVNTASTCKLHTERPSDSPKKLSVREEKNQKTESNDLHYQLEPVKRGNVPN